MSSWPELDVERMLACLTARDVDFVIVGGIAVVLLGSARLTQDLDIAYAQDQANLDALGNVLLDLDARLRGVDEAVRFVPDGRTLRHVELLTLTTDAGSLDLLGRPPGAPPYAELRRNAQHLDVGQSSVRVASIDDMIAMKRNAGRAQDLADIEELETILRLRNG